MVRIKVQNIQKIKYSVRLEMHSTYLVGHKHMQFSVK